MGRGLSELQQVILKRALINRIAERRHPNWPIEDPKGADVTYPEVLVEYFGWPVDEGSRSLIIDYKGGKVTCTSLSKFSQTEIGDDRYNAAHAALSRAVRRLEARGLVYQRSGIYHNWSGLNLTDEGIAVARELSDQVAVPWKS